MGGVYEKKNGWKAARFVDDEHINFLFNENNLV